MGLFSLAAAQLEQPGRHKRIACDANGKASESPEFERYRFLLAHSGKRRCEGKKAATERQKTKPRLL